MHQGKNPMPSFLAAVLVLAAWMILLPCAKAVAGNCAFQITRQGSKYTKDVLKALERCQQKILDGFIPSQDCWQEEKAKRKIAVTTIKYRERVQKKCFGITPSQLGFPTAQCPGVTDINDIINCMLSLQNQHVKEIIAADLGLSLCTGFRALNCDDGDACTIDSCDENAGGCINTPLCGNGVIDGACGELCDGINLNGETCLSQGFLGGGTLACSATCIFDSSQCIP